MTVVVSMLRGVNVGGHNIIKMEALRAVYESLGLLNVQTHIQSGNVLFKTKDQDLDRLTKRIQDAIEKTFGFRPGVVLRTTSDLRDIIARNPFHGRPGIDPRKLLISFLAAQPDAESQAKALALNVAPEELRIDGRELFIYYANGIARPKLSMPQVERALKTTGTARNWNTVTKLLELAEKL
jgi:uncharacterized protein (DUF1697 family)